MSYFILNHVPRIMIEVVLPYGVELDEFHIVEHLQQNLQSTATETVNLSDVTWVVLFEEHTHLGTLYRCLCYFAEQNRPNNEEDYSALWPFELYLWGFAQKLANEQNVEQLILWKLDVLDGQIFLNVLAYDKGLCLGIWSEICPDLDRERIDYVKSRLENIVSDFKRVDADALPIIYDCAKFDFLATESYENLASDMLFKKLNLQSMTGCQKVVLAQDVLRVKKSLWISLAVAALFALSLTGYQFWINQNWTDFEQKNQAFFTEQKQILTLQKTQDSLFLVWKNQNYPTSFAPHPLPILQKIKGSLPSTMMMTDVNWSVEKDGIRVHFGLYDANWTPFDVAENTLKKAFNRASIQLSQRVQRTDGLVGAEMTFFDAF
jgi:hypothetical protein